MRIIISIVLCIISSLNFLNSQSLVRYVDPLIGTDGLGHTFPGATLPFGMVQLSPSNDYTDWSRCSGYHYTDKEIKGFAHNHISGAGLSGLGDILLMPISIKDSYGNKKDLMKGYSSRFSHNEEYASPGYYKVSLSDYNIDVELTASMRTGVSRYTFNKTDSAYVVIDPTHKLMDELDSVELSFEDLYTISGCKFTKNGTAGKRKTFFIARFSNPIRNIDIVKDKRILKLKGSYKADSFFAIISLGKLDKPLEVKVALSYTSKNGAYKNLQETIDKTFDEVFMDAERIWNKKLGSIIIDSDVKTKRIFYTSLYHSFISPNLISDVDNKYCIDGNIYDSDIPQYSNFSSWDTYRALHPLLLLLDQNSTVSFVNSLVSRYSKLGKTLPIWECLGYDNLCMIGYNTIPIIGDAILANLKGIDILSAYNAMKDASMNTDKNSPNYDVNGMDDYKSFSFVPGEIGCSVSKTVEYNYFDWVISQVAKKINFWNDYDYYKKRSLGYRHLFDNKSKFLLPKKSSGITSNIDVKNWNDLRQHYVSGNLWGYSCYIPHDIRYVIEKHGGKEQYSKFLDNIFGDSIELNGNQHVDISGFIGKYAHGDEPSHHVPYLYNFTNKPWKTQECVSNILSKFYTDSPNGLINNDDLGQMSAWCVFSYLGFYPVCPGSGYYMFGSPRINKGSIKIGNSTFNVITKNNSLKNVYIKEVYLNGKNYSKNYILYNDLIKGGDLIFVMDSVPNKNRGISDEDLPFDVPIEYDIHEFKKCFTPYIVDDIQLYSKKKLIEIKSKDYNDRIYYSIDGTTPTDKSNLYEKPFYIDSTCIIKAISYSSFEKKLPSKIYSREFIKAIVKDSVFPKINLLNPPTNYGDNSGIELIDGYLGGLSFSSGGWTGFCGENKDLEAIIDLGKVYNINNITFNYLINISSWIFPPSSVVLYGGKSTNNFEYICNSNKFEKVEDNLLLPRICRKTIEFTPQDIRYIKLKVKNYGIIPKWHSGNGSIPYLFIDELIIN